MTARYRAGWLIPNQVLALTHFVPDVSMEDFMGISEDSIAALASAADEFYVLIDNRIIQNTQLAPLSMMLESAPYMKHPNLQQIIMIIPEAYEGSAADIPEQQEGDISLSHVDTLEDAYQSLRSLNNGLDWDSLDTEFFEPK